MPQSVAAVAPPLSYVAVDDEPLGLCAFIEQAPFLKLAGRWSSAVAALKALHEQPKV